VVVGLASPLTDHGAPACLALRARCSTRIRDCKDHPGIDPNECQGGCSRNLLVTYRNVQQDGCIASAGEPDLAEQETRVVAKGHDAKQRRVRS